VALQSGVARGRSRQSMTPFWRPRAVPTLRLSTEQMTRPGRVDASERAKNGRLRVPPTARCYA
jgi:hypothetical protein